MNGDLKKTFIIKAINDYYLMVQKQMIAMAAKYKVGVSGDAIRSLTHKVMEQGAGASGNLYFKEYLRFVDMGVGRSHPLGGMKLMKVTLQSKHLTGNAFVKNKTRKPKKIYSKSAYGNLGWLQNKLLYGYTEETILMLKKEMENASSNN